MYDPFGKFEKRRQKNMKTQNGSTDWEDSRGDASGVVHGCSFDSIDTFSFIMMMKRE
jgi:hypothetical protein